MEISNDEKFSGILFNASVNECVQFISHKKYIFLMVSPFFRFIGIPQCQLIFFLVPNHILILTDNAALYSNNNNIVCG